MDFKFCKVLTISLLALSSLSIWARADGPTTQTSKPNPAADDQDYVISPMRVQEMKGINYLFVSSQTSLAQLGQEVHQSMEKLTPDIKRGEIKPVGAPLIIFHGVNQDPNSQFPLQVGFPVAEDAKAPDGLEIKKLDSFRCATVLFSGSLQQIHHAYEKVYNDLLSEGLQPTDEGRQAILLFEGEDSVNNVAMIQIGVQ
jgi:predicted transcriptional regulator YdeE